MIDYLHADWRWMKRSLEQYGRVLARFINKAARYAVDDENTKRCMNMGRNGADTIQGQGMPGGADLEWVMRHQSGFRLTLAAMMTPGYAS